MNRSIKAHVVSDRRKNSGFSEESSPMIDRSIDCHLVDVEEFLVDLENFDQPPPRLEGQKLDVVLMDSALPSKSLMKMALRVRDGAPDVPVLLLPQSDIDLDKAKTLETTEDLSPSRVRADTMVKAVRYARNRQRC